LRTPLTWRTQSFWKTFFLGNAIHQEELFAESTFHPEVLSLEDTDQIEKLFTENTVNYPEGIVGGRHFIWRNCLCRKQVT
jgi:hypothetical protein